MFGKRNNISRVDDNATSKKAALPSRRHSGRGVAALELAILMPLLLMIIFGIIDWGYVFYVDLTLTNGVREGARVGVTRNDVSTAQTDAKTAATNYVSTLGAHNDIVISATMTNTDQLSVQARIDNFQPLVGFLPDSALPSTISTQASMRWELAGQ